MSFTGFIGWSSYKGYIKKALSAKEYEQVYKSSKGLVQIKLLHPFWRLEEDAWGTLRSMSRHTDILRLFRYFKRLLKWDWVKFYNLYDGPYPDENHNFIRASIYIKERGSGNNN